MNSKTLKIIACVVMLIDHIGAILFPQYRLMRYIGRLAFPLFAYQITISYSKTRDRNRFVKRLAIFAVLSQIPYMMNFGAGLNIFFTLIAAVLLIMVYEKNKKLGIVAIGLSLLLANGIHLDYGWYGIATILVFYFFNETSSWVIAQVNLTVLYSLTNAVIQGFSLLALPLIYFYNGQRGSSRLKYAFYVFYPVHLLFLTLIKHYY